MNMKKILLAMAMILPMLSGADVNAQGVVVYQNDGKCIAVPYERLDSIVTYETVPPEGLAVVADAVDLGLPSGTLWASWNVGATKPYEYGGYYAWGETSEKERYTESTYGHYDQTSQGYIHIGDDISGTEYDVAHVMWGDGWHMPTDTQIQELVDSCTWEWITYNGTVNGYMVTGSNGNSIFLPAAGYCSSSDVLNYAGIRGNYLSGSFDSSDSQYACGLYFASSYHRFSSSFRYRGQSVRPVK